MSQRITKTAFVIALAFAGTAFAENLPVVASFSILGDVAKQIGGERVSVTSLVGPDQDAHAYQINSGDVKKIAAAKLVLLNGLGLEQADVIRAVQQSRVPYAEAAQGITPLKSEEEHEHHHDHDGHDHEHGHEHHHHDHGAYDPHVWNDPVLMQKYAANVTAALTKADPAGAAYYQARLKNYSAELTKLDS